MSKVNCQAAALTRTLPGWLALALLCLYSNASYGQFELVSPPQDDPMRTEPVEPFKIVDGVFFVGARLNSPSYLFTTPEGHILLDTTFDEHVSEIVDNIEQLGFSTNDIKLLISSHAHHDHVGGHASMREITGATSIASAADADVIESGGATDFRDRGTWAPATVDRIIEDGEQVRLGDRVLTAHFTPGHTKGCTTWTTGVEENGRELDLVVLGGLRVNNNEPLVNHPDYPEMPQDFAWSFARLKVLPVDIYLGAHGYWYNVKEKHDRLLAGADTNPFIDPEGYANAIRFWENAYLEQLAIEGYGNAD